MSAQHTPATARIQRRLERLELEHLRQHATDLAERVETLELKVDQLERDVYAADASADMWRDAHHSLTEHLDDGTADARCIGLTQQGDLLVVRTGATQ